MEGFGTAGIRGSTRERITPSFATVVGGAVGTDAETVVLGRDGRTTSPALADAFAAGVLSAGASVRRLGEVPTAAVGFASRECHGAMITASHNPPADNGIKLFADGAEIGPERERTIEAHIESERGPLSWDRWGEGRRGSALSDYRQAVVEYARTATAPDGGPVETPPEGTVVVDCGNGMAARATPPVLRSLGVDVTTLNDNVDGHFPGRASKPTAETLEEMRAFVDREPAAAFGIGHDGDADRIVIADAEGTIVHEDTILAILAEHAVENTPVGDPVVVTTPNASDRVDERVAAAGGRVERTPLGRLPDGVRAAEGTVVFAGEPWKHSHPELGPWIDGTASAAVLAQLVGQAGGLDALREPVTERPYVKRNVDCPEDRKAPAMTALEDQLPDRYPDATVETGGGVRLRWPDRSWALVRPSGTEAYLRVYVEAPDAPERADELVDTVAAAVDATANS